MTRDLITYSKHIKKWFYHFQDRLKYRYKIDVEFKEYLELCKKKDFELLKTNENGQLIIKLHFKDTEIKAVKQDPKKGKLLITALK
jgi:hypothetical protein